MRWRVVLALVTGGSVALAIGFGLRANKAPTAPIAAPHHVESRPDAGVRLGVEEEDKSPLLHPPTGKLASLSCSAAAAILAEVRHELAFTAGQPTAQEFASATKDWIDPHGHWAVASDATPFVSIDADAAALLAEVSDGTKCPAALRIGRSLATWINSERTRFDAKAAASSGDDTRALVDALDVTTHDAGAGHKHEAAALTDELAERSGALTHGFGAVLAKYVQSARDRFFPEMTAEAWSEVVLGAAVRAWVEQVDVHGAWAPYGEEAAVHDVDLDQDAPSRLWSRATRTLLGVRIDDGALAPFAVGDVVLEVDGLLLAGLAVEQLDELALTATDAGQPFDAVVMREGERVPRVLRVDPDVPTPTLASPSAHPFDLAAETIPYGSGEVVIVTIPDIYDDLGELFVRALARARTPKLVGLVIDLRGDGGGSTEGAIDTLGIFLPGARLFPMRSRSGAIDTDRAPERPLDEQWTGPVATLIDSGTASAAEMLAGALAAYRRGPSVGSLTYGKGCAQEYVDDDAHAGLLRMTTLLFALPDGSPVQRVGLTPTITFPFRGDVSDDREAKLVRAPPSWTGPDVRDRAWLGKASQFAWPSAGGVVGPCHDESVCKALALVAEPRRRTEARRPPSVQR